MDGSHFTRPHGGTVPSTRDEGPDPTPDREWTLSAGQVVTAVLAILAACELIAALA